MTIINWDCVYAGHEWDDRHDGDYVEIFCSRCFHVDMRLNCKTHDVEFFDDPTVGLMTLEENC